MTHRGSLDRNSSRAIGSRAPARRTGDRGDSLPPPRDRDAVASLDPAVCERARLSRDPRFDGRFFIGVRTTGVYCRTVCPVKPPLARNVVFFPTAAAAGEAGFRPCLRCRPEQSAGTPDWCRGPEIVGRALRLIAAGAVDDDSAVARVAERLGVSARHLQRLFQRYLGAAPLAVLRTRRLHVAKRLLDETDLGMAEIAFAAGFGSVRRFNATFRELYDRTPRELRAARAGGRTRIEPEGRRRSSPRPARPGLRVHDEGGDRPRGDRSRGDRANGDGAPPTGFTFRLAYRPPFDWPRHLAYLVPRAIPGVEEAADGVYRRTFRAGGQVGSLEVRQAADRGPALELRVSPVEPIHLPALIERARRVFDLGADPDVIRRHLRGDPALRPWVDRCPALRVPGAWDGFELAMRAVIGQQISVVAASTLTGRLARRWGEPLGEGSQVVFPRADTLVDADLASIGLPRARGETLRLLARAVASGELSIEPGADPAAVRERLIAIPGIGEWTAQYVALRALGEPDAFPASDLGLLRSPANGGASSARELHARAEAWRPWRAYAAMVLWRAQPEERAE